MAWQSPGSSAGGTTIQLGTADSLFIAAQVAISGSSGYGFDGSGTGQRVVIHGTIAAANGGILGATAALGNNNWLQVGATGRLQAFTSSAFTLYGSGRIDNAGAISSFEGRGIEISKVGSSGGTVITNSGLIEGATYGILVTGDASEGVSLNNSGTIRGVLAAYADVSTTGHIDYLTNTGSIVGDVQLANGADLFDGRLGTLEGNLFGGSGNDRLYTGAGDQLMNGGEGDDSLIGGAGADTFYGGGGFDTVSYSGAASRVVLNLVTSGSVGDAAGDVFNFLGTQDVEGVIGTAFNDGITGNALANRIAGGAGNDTLNGGQGNDTLTGGSGQDTFVFNNTRNSNTNSDRITDYVVADDSIRLDDNVFPGIGPVGTLAAAAFRINTTGLAGDATDRIIYNSNSGALYFDSNGSAAGGSVRIGFLPGGLAMANTEFTVF